MRSRRRRPSGPRPGDRAEERTTRHVQLSDPSTTMVTGIPAGKGAGSVTEESSRALWLQQARSNLRNADPVLARLIDARPAFDPRAWMAQLPPMDLYGALLFQVTGQQLSVAATRRTLARVQALFDDHLPAPPALLPVDPRK